MIGRNWMLFSLTVLCLLLFPVSHQLLSQTGSSTAAVATRIVGTLVARTPTSLTIKPDSGDAVTVTLAPETSVLSLAPGSTDLKAAQPASAADLDTNDRVLVLLAAGASSPMARRVLVMKSTAIAAQQHTEEQGWAHSRGGVVQAVDPAAASFTVKSSGRILTVSTSATTAVRQYAPGSIRFEDARRSSLAALHSGDQVRIRGTVSSPTTMAADELVFGSFLQLAGQVISVDVTASRLTLRDSKTKAPITVVLTPRTELRNLPPELAQRLAARSAATGHGAPSHDAQTASAPAPRAPDPAEAIAQLPALPTSSLKPGDAVLLVATTGPDHVDTATTVLTGAAPILAAIESGGGETSLSAWSLGGGGTASASTE